MRFVLALSMSLLLSGCFQSSDWPPHNIPPDTGMDFWNYSSMTRWVEIVTRDGMPGSSQGKGVPVEPHAEAHGQLPSATVTWGCGDDPDGPYWIKANQYDHEDGALLQTKTWPLEKCGNTRFSLVIHENGDMSLHEMTRDGGYKREPLPTSSGS
jgi:hypothetical protein